MTWDELPEAAKEEFRQLEKINIRAIGALRELDDRLSEIRADIEWNTKWFNRVWSVFGIVGAMTISFVLSFVVTLIVGYFFNH